jgi:hypothetical protein
MRVSQDLIVIGTGLPRLFLLRSAWNEKVKVVMRRGRTSDDDIDDAPRAGQPTRQCSGMEHVDQVLGIRVNADSPLSTIRISFRCDLPQ